MDMYEVSRDTKTPSIELCRVCIITPMYNKIKIQQTKYKDDITSVTI
jgi:hypothetical protein